LIIKTLYYYLGLDGVKRKVAEENIFLSLISTTAEISIIVIDIQKTIAKK